MVLCMAANVCFILIHIHSLKNIKNVIKLFLEIIKDPLCLNHLLFSWNYWLR